MNKNGHSLPDQILEKLNISFFRKKVLIAIFFVPALILVFHYSFYFSTANIVKSERSINPEATRLFIHANVISTLWIKTVHDKLFVDYDSFLMRALIDLTNYFFEKAETKIKPHNAEAGIWWFLTYANIYNLSSSDRLDNSLDIYTLSKDSEWEIRHKLADYVTKIGFYGVKGVDFDKYESSAMHTMFATSFSEIDLDKHYKGITERDRVNAYWSDDELYDIRKKTYEAYTQFLEKDMFLDGWELYAQKSINSRLWTLIVKDVDKGKVMMNCKNRYIEDYLNGLRKLNELRHTVRIDSVPNIKFQNDYNRSKVTHILLLDILHTSCENFQTKIDEIKIEL